MKYSNQNPGNLVLEPKKLEPFADSNCVLRWTLPQSEILIWKKLSLQESLSNLAKIGAFLDQELWQKLYLEVTIEKNNLSKNNPIIQNDDSKAKSSNLENENSPEKTTTSLNYLADLHQKTLLIFWETGDLELWAVMSATFWEREIKNWLLENNYKTGDFLWPLRVALSGQKQSPSPFEILACLDYDSTKKRIELCLKDTNLQN